MFAFVAAAAVVAAEVLAVVNGKPITRADLEAALKDPTRHQYHEAVADLRDVEHAAARDFLGRRAAEREASQQRARVYSAERASLEDLIEQRLFEAAARARGLSADELTRALRSKVAPVTKKDLAFIKAYEGSKQQATATI